MVVGNIDCELVGRLVEGCAGVVVGSIVLLLVAEPVEGGIEIESDDVGTVVGNIVLLLVVALSVEGGIDTESNEVHRIQRSGACWERSKCSRLRCGWKSRGRTLSSAATNRRGIHGLSLHTGDTFTRDVCCKFKIYTISPDVSRKNY